jgi:hypothetical protein
MRRGAGMELLKEEEGTRAFPNHTTRRAIALSMHDDQRIWMES